MITFYEVIRFLNRKGYSYSRCYAGANAELWCKGDHSVIVYNRSMNPYQFQDFMKCLL